MSEFTTKINLLQSNTFIKELKVKHFKTLLKSLLGDEPNSEDVFINFLNVLTYTTQYDIDELQALSVIDFILLVLYVRCISIGNSVQLEITDQENTKITLDLYKVIDTIKNSINFNFKQTINKITIEYQFLSIKDFLFLENFDRDLLICKKYIKKIHFNNESINTQLLKDEEFLLLFKELPANYSSTIFKCITELNKQINQINLLQHLTDKNISLYLNRSTFTFILQILFSKNLLPLYENIFGLAKFANISPEYIEECTPGEYTLFVKLLERILKEQIQATQQPTNNLPPINTNSPNFM